MLLTKKQETSWNCGAWTAPCFNSLRIPAPASAWEFSQLTSCTSRLSTVTPGTSLISEKIHAYLCKTLNSKKNTNVSRNFKIMVQAGIIRINSPIGLCMLRVRMMEMLQSTCFWRKNTQETSWSFGVWTAPCFNSLRFAAPVPACDFSQITSCTFRLSSVTPPDRKKWWNPWLPPYFRKDTCLPM